MNQQQSNKRGHFYSILLALIIGLIGTAWSLHHPRAAQPEQPQLPQAGEGLTVYLLPAGEGQCILATCGGETLLLDGGSADFGQTAADFLRSRKVQRIDLLVSSRPDDAYSGGLATIVQNFPVKTVWNAGVFSSMATAGEEAFLAALRAANKEFSLPEPDEAFALGDAEVRLRTVDSLLELTYGETTCVLGGNTDSALLPVTDSDVTVYVSDGEQIYCLTESGG